MILGRNVLYGYAGVSTRGQVHGAKFTLKEGFCLTLQKVPLVGIIKNAAGSRMATVENGQGIVQAKGGTILLKAGVFAGGDSTKSVSVATGETAPVVIGNITFGTASAAAAGSYTSAAAVSFASGQISVAAAETNPVAVTAGNVTYTTKAATLTTLAQENGSAVLVEGSVVLDPNEAIAVKGVGTLTNNGSIAISVTYTADKTKSNKIFAITGMEDGEAVAFGASFTGGEVTVDGTAFTAITSRNGHHLLAGGWNLQL